MTVCAVTMFRDEFDVGVDALRHMASEGVGKICVLDNLSTDEFRESLDRAAVEIGDAFGCEVRIIDDDEPGYYQASKITAAACALAENTPDLSWVIPFDADELWYADRPVAEVLAGCDADVVHTDSVDHVVTPFDLDDASPFRSMIWQRRDPENPPIGKVAFRWREGAHVTQGSHSVEFADGRPVVEGPRIGLRHFPYRSPEQFVRKAILGGRAYRAAADLPPSMGSHWRAYLEVYERDGEDALTEWFAKHFTCDDRDALIADPAPFRRWG